MRLQAMGGGHSVTGRRKIIGVAIDELGSDQFGWAGSICTFVAQGPEMAFGK
jgi:hypothetical protein